MSVAVAATLALISVAAVPADAAAVGEFPFPVTTTQLWLGAESGTVPGANGTVPLLQPQAPTGATSDMRFIPVLEQLGLGQHEASWFAAPAWNRSLEPVGDVEVDLYFFLNVEATTRLHVQLDDLAPDGTLTSLGAQDLSFVVATTGRSVPAQIACPYRYIEPLAPAVAAGIALNAGPWCVAAWAAKKFPDDTNVISLWKILAGLPAFTLWAVVVVA
ncbi:MAG: hypothetical protein ABR562_05605, partial [Thermoplasmatota archaeon]